MPENKSLTEQLKAALPQPLAQDPAVTTALEAICRLEQRAQTLDAEREFLDRAPREGLMYPSDALKLVDVAAKLGGGQKIDALYAELRKDKPWLFSKQTSPANEKISTGHSDFDRLREAVKHGALSRDVQNFRPIKRARK